MNILIFWLLLGEWHWFCDAMPQDSEQRFPLFRWDGFPKSATRTPQIPAQPSRYKRRYPSHFLGRFQGFRSSNHPLYARNLAEPLTTHKQDQRLDASRWRTSFSLRRLLMDRDVRQHPCTCFASTNDDCFGKLYGTSFTCSSRTTRIPHSFPLPHRATIPTFDSDSKIATDSIVALVERYKDELERSPIKLPAQPNVFDDLCEENEPDKQLFSPHGKRSTHCNYAERHLFDDDNNGDSKDVKAEKQQTPDESSVALTTAEGTEQVIISTNTETNEYAENRTREEEKDIAKNENMEVNNATNSSTSASNSTNYESDVISNNSTVLDRLLIPPKATSITYTAQDEKVMKPNILLIVMGSISAIVGLALSAYLIVWIIYRRTHEKDETPLPPSVQTPVGHVNYTSNPLSEV